MSYSFGMTFFHVNNLEDAFCKARNFAAEMVTPESAKELLIDNMRFTLNRFKRKAREETDNAITVYLDDWLASLFTVRFTYWPEHDLLGATGDRWPKKCIEQADGSVFFQNSTDQDYQFEWWPGKIAFFQERIAAIKDLPDSEIKKLGLVDTDIPEEDLQEALDYARRSLLYKKVYTDLHLENWLYGPDGGFQRFAMSGIASSDIAFSLYNRARVMILKGKGYL